MQYILPLFEDLSYSQVLYYFLFRPDKPVLSITNKYKEEADAFLNEKYHITKPPHISLIQFLLPEKEESKLIDITRKTIENASKPEIVTSGIELFRDSRTICVALKKQERAHQIKDKLIQELSKAYLLKNKKSLKFNSKNLHISIARHVESNKLNQLHQHFKQFEFNPITFTCSQLILLKDPTFQEKWTKVEEFKLS